MAESYYYDPETNKLVVGEAALAAESAGWEMGDYDPELPPADDNHGNLYNLQDALADETVLPTASKPSERPRVAKWDTESIILVGQWLSKLLKGRDVNTIREGHIRILNALDMSPSIKTIERRVGSFSQFRANANDEMSIWKLRASQAQPLPAAETYYDRHTKKLVIGRAALAVENARWEMGDHDFEEPPSDEA